MKMRPLIVVYTEMPTVRERVQSILEEELPEDMSDLLCFMALLSTASYNPEALLDDPELMIVAVVAGHRRDVVYRFAVDRMSEMRSKGHDQRDSAKWYNYTRIVAILGAGRE